ncbi:MAG: T9SS type A sorting domain-containing protein, partial [Gammaproteobacteria bacterium]|nr:T9SS type A sorting domain-containing protein [Gammaproteobacteria bacterium]
VNDTAWQTLTIENRGIQPLTISAVGSVNGSSGVGQVLPAVIPAMGRTDFDVYAYPTELGPFSDTLRILSNDPVKPEVKLPVAADVQNIFVIVDNEDSLNYSEYGSWFYSNAQAYGPTSRYAPLGNGAYATFTFSLETGGIYDIYEIVPTTQNAANNAHYRISAGGMLLDSLYVDQNAGSGEWVQLGQYTLPANVPVEVKVIDVGGNTQGVVLRADAIKFALVEEIIGIEDDEWLTLPQQFEFEQNYPNPFNATTHFRYALARPENVSLQVFNGLGQLVATVVNERQSPGRYDINWQADAFASGVYFARFQAGAFIKTRKLMLLK